MKNPCKDCGDKNTSKYSMVDRPDYYVMGVDTKRQFQYIIPVNDAAGNLPKDYYRYDIQDTEADEFNDWVTDSVNAGYGQLVLLGANFSGGIFETIQDGINFVTNNPEVSNVPSGDGVIITVDNPNYGKTISKHPSFLFWEWEPYQKPYSFLKDPNWLVSFPICTSNDNGFNDNNSWKLKGCGVWKIEWKLRVRPLIPLSFYAEGYGAFCEDYGFADIGFNIDNYKIAKEVMRFYKSLHSQEGSKYLGIAPMRIETGIYSHDTNKYKPVVWSDGKYPQVLPNERRYWSKDYPKEMSFAKYDNINSYSKTPYCDRKTWFVGSNTQTINTTSYYSGPNQEDIFYEYNSVSSLSPGDGKFIPGSNDLQQPGTLKFSMKDNISKKTLLDFVNLFDNSGDGNKVAELEIEIQGRYDGVWLTSSVLNYNVSNISTANSLVTLSVNDNLSNPTFENNLGSGYSNTEFFNFDNIDTRYQITINNYIPEKTTPKFNIANVIPQTFTPLTEDFVVELEGFTHIDLDKDREVSIYLKVLPEHNDYGSSGINQVYPDFNDRSASMSPWYPILSGNTNVLSAPSTSTFWPWAPLSMDFRNSWQESIDVKYEPFLPLDLDRDIITTNNTLNDKDFRRGYNISHNIKGWYIMIENGWVSAEPVCEDCDC